MIRRDFRDRSGGGATRTSRDSYLVCQDSRDQDLPFPDFRDQKTRIRRGYGATLRLRKRRDWRYQTFPNFPDRDGDGAIFQTNTETFRGQFLVCPDFRGPRRYSCPDFPDSKFRRDYAFWV